MQQFSPYRVHQLSYQAYPQIQMSPVQQLLSPQIYQSVQNVSTQQPYVKQKQTLNESNPKLRQLEEELNRTRTKNKQLEQQQIVSITASEQFLQVEKRIQSLIEENKTVNDLLKEKMAESDRLITRNAEMEIELNKLRGMESEMAIVKEVAELRHKEAEKYRIKCNQLEKELRDAQNQLSEQLNKNKLCNQEVIQWKSRFTELDQERLRQLEQTRFTLDTIRQQEIEQLKIKYVQQVEQLERNLEILTHEYDKQNGQIKIKSEELDQWKIKFSKLEVKYNNDLSKYEEDYKRQQQERSDLKKQLSEQDMNRDDMDSKIQMLILEIERLNGVVQGKNEEIDKFRKLLEQTAQQIPLFQEKNKIRELVQENRKLKQDNDSFTKEIDQMKKSIKSVQSISGAHQNK